MEEKEIQPKQCICHKEPSTELHEPEELFALAENTWDTFKYAAFQRKDDIYVQYRDLWDQGPFGDCHKRCYKQYVNPDHIKRRKLCPAIPCEMPVKECHKTRSVVYPIDLTFCVICQKDRKSAKNRRVNENLVTCSTDEARLNLIRAAEIRQDSGICTCLQDTDFIALKVKYHRTCYKNFINKDQLQRIPLQHRLKTDIQQNETYRNGECGCGEGSKSEDCVAENMLKIYKAAKVIRSAIKDMKSSISWPPCSDDLCLSTFKLPIELFNLLGWILSDRTDVVNGPINTTPFVEKRVLTIGQDLIYSVSKGRIKTPKHVSLPMTVKNLTGSAQMVNLLNNFGYGIAYSQLLEVETAIAEKQLDKCDNGICLPSNIQPNVFSVFCWDNNDIMEETLSGKGTTHCTNGIIIQRETGASHPASSAYSQQRSQRRRSLQVAPIPVLPYVSRGREGPAPNQLIIKDWLAYDAADYQGAVKMDFLWFLARQEMVDTFMPKSNCKQLVPSWSAFNATLQEQDTPNKSVVGYLQVIDESPTKLSADYTLLKRSVNLACRLNLKDVVIIVDQPIYAKISEIIWKNPSEFKHVVPCMGDFHTMCGFMSIIGKRFGEAGLEDLLIESEVIAPGSVQGVLKGKHYNRCIRLYSLVSEALLRLEWERFSQWMINEKKNHNANILQIIGDVRKETTIENVSNALNSQEFEQCFDLYEEFLASELQEPMALFWRSFLDMAQLLLQFKRSIREGNWHLHLACIRDMMPWFFAYDCIHYSRYLPVYWSQMATLHLTHPEAFENLSSGNFVVQRGSKPFSQVPIDQTIEETLNKATKVKGGIIGFSMNKSAVHRWTITAHERARITEMCKDMAGISDTSNTGSHKEAQYPRMKQDEEDVCKIASTLKSWGEPFLHTHDLVHLATGVRAPDDVTSDLLDARKKGYDALEKFTMERICTSNVSIYDPIQKLKLKTFVHAIVGCNAPIISKSAHEDLFGRLSVIAQKRKMNMRTVLTYCLDPYPMAIATSAGDPAHTDKSKMCTEIEKNIHPTEDIPPTAPTLFDGMQVIHAIVNPPRTFGGLARAILTRIINFAPLARRIDVIFDVYKNQGSIKETERKRRSRVGILDVAVKKAEQKVSVQWEKFLCSPKSKASFIEFLNSEWQKNDYACFYNGREFYATCNEECYKFFVENKETKTECISELCTSQEEADTRLLYHTKHAADAGHGTVIIHSSDTDVELLACYYQCKLSCNIIMFKAGKLRNQYVCIRNIVDNMEPDMPQALLELHAFTGCDSTSCFVRKGKAKPLKMVSADANHRDTMSKLGTSFTVTEKQHKSMEKFVSELYGYKTDDINECRYQIYSKKGSQSSGLPPNQDCLRNHTERANYQTAIWKAALIGFPDVPSPVGHGWNKDYTIKWMDLPPAPLALVELKSCSCTGDCSNNRCTCRRLKLQCTDACKCSGCVNSYVEECLHEDINEDN